MEEITALVVAVDRYIDRANESDELVRRQLWTEMAAASERLAEAAGVYPLAGEVALSPEQIQRFEAAAARGLAVNRRAAVDAEGWQG